MDGHNNINSLNGQGNDDLHQQQSSSQMNLDPELHNDFAMIPWAMNNMPGHIFPDMGQLQMHQQQVVEVAGTFRATSRLSAQPALPYLPDEDDAISPTGRVPTYHLRNPNFPQTFPDQRQYFNQVPYGYGEPPQQPPYPANNRPWTPVTPIAPIAPVAPQESQPVEDNRVPIPKLSTCTQAPMTVAPTGPMSREVNLKPRAKPGRKPMTDNKGEVDERRKCQNRTAQRKFRDKRQTKIDDLEAELQIERQARRTDEAEHRRQMHQLQEHLNQQQERHQIEVNQLNERIMNLDMARAPVLQAPNPVTRPHQDSTAAFDTPENNEMDFTTRYGTALSAETMTDCGFCTDQQNCQCRPVVKAGDCDRCRQDPDLAADCRRAATMGQMGPSPSSQQQPGHRMTCSDLVGHLRKGELMGGLKRMQGSPLHFEPAASGGYEVNEREAAKALEFLRSSKAAW